MTRPRIVLVGFMGSGKTTVGKALARRLDCDYVDLDTFITENIGRTPAEIIREKGEPAFRAIETRALNNLLKQSERRVIALGGGAWAVAANRALVDQQKCLTVWLNAPFELCWQRITTSHDIVRPMAPDLDTARQLFKSRLPGYGLASVRIEVREGDSADAVAQKILSVV